MPMVPAMAPAPGPGMVQTSRHSAEKEVSMDWVRSVALIERKTNIKLNSSATGDVLLLCDMRANKGGGSLYH